MEVSDNIYDPVIIQAPKSSWSRAGPLHTHTHTHTHAHTHTLSSLRAGEGNRNN